mmetsp:Transcript_26683/g.61389  ORF Transcript_26683/g.61389 Transcript_26683/m.61389 type:complete len:134 (-) Transcript_26683:254-655(-)
MKVSAIVSLASYAVAGVVFVASPSFAFSTSGSLASSSVSSTRLPMANEDDLLRWARSSRSASAGDRVVELKRPLGVVLESDDSGNVYVDAVAPKGNAARSGLVSNIYNVATICVTTFVKNKTNILLLPIGERR